MFISDVLNKSSKIKVKSSRMMEVKRYFLSMYRCYMTQLYDKGYIDDPSVFNSKVIMKNIVDLGIGVLFNYAGKIDLSPSHVLFGYYKNKDNPEKADFLITLYNVLKYQEFSKKVDSIYEEFSFRGKVIGVINYKMFTKGAKIVQKSSICFDEAFSRCVSKFEEDTKKLSISEELWGIAMRELGIPEEEHTNDGLMDGTLTHAEEVACIEGILNGYFKVSNGKYTDLLHNWLLNHRWGIDNNSNYKAYMLGLYDYLYGAYVLDVEKVITEKINDLDSKGYSILAINENNIYYNTPRTTLDMPFGVFAVVCDNTSLDESLLSDVNIFNGYTGELYTEDRLIDDGVDFVGCPIVMNTSYKDEGLFYDLEQTDIKSASWFGSDDDITIDFDENAEGMGANPFDEGTLPYELYEGYLNSLRSSDGLINTINVSSSKDLAKAKSLVFKYFKE